MDQDLDLEKLRQLWLRDDNPLRQEEPPLSAKEVKALLQTEPEPPFYAARRVARRQIALSFSFLVACVLIVGTVLWRRPQPADETAFFANNTAMAVLRDNGVTVSYGNMQCNNDCHPELVLEELYQFYKTMQR